MCGIGIPLWRWRSDPLIRSLQTYSATGAGLRFHTIMADSTVAWSFYRRAVEYPDFYIRFAGRRGRCRSSSGPSLALPTMPGSAASSPPTCRSSRRAADPPAFNAPIGGGAFHYS